MSQDKANDAAWLREQLFEAIKLLDAGLPLYVMQAVKEEDMEPHMGTLKPTTCRRRAEAVKRIICTVGPVVGYDQ